jgi:hypothetical protein
MEHIENYKYSSSIIFRYYEDFELASKFFREVLQLEKVMDQGFARVYKINETSFIGCVKKSEGSIPLGTNDNTLVSLNTKNVDKEYDRLIEFNLPKMSKCEVIERIPLKSFFFTDYEGYDYEIQQFLKKEDLDLF